jgi:hypothetical protein
MGAGERSGTVRIGSGLRRTSDKSGLISGLDGFIHRHGEIGD